MFSTQSDNFIPFVHIFDVISLFAADLEEPNGLYFVFKGSFFFNSGYINGRPFVICIDLLSDYQKLIFNPTKLIAGI